MSSLTVYHESNPGLPNKVLTYAEDITATLAEHGVRFERWQAATPILRGASEEAIINAYRVQIDGLMTQYGYRNVDVVSVERDHPQKAQLRAKLLDEHCLDEDAVRFFVAGRGLFTLHMGEYVYALLCEKDDLVVVPAQVAHWFDMGEEPHLVAIRLFNEAEGVVARFTGEEIASRFARLDD